MNHNAQALYTSKFITLCLSFAFFGASFNMIIPELPSFLTGLGGAEYKGFIIALFTLTAGFSRPFSGKLADTIGRIPVIITGAIVCIMCSLMYPLLTTVGAFMFLRLCHGFSTGFTPTAITAYVASLSSYNSPFDQYMRGETQSIDPKVIKGFNLFAGKAACATCHFIPTFSGLVPASFKESESEVLGVPEKWIPQGNMTLDSDQGRINSGKPRDEAPHLAFSFKTTTLRNIAKTAPYMHNGAFNSLQDVMQFYNKGGGVGLGFSLEYQTLSPDPLNLSDAEIADIILFMESLTSLPKMEY